MRAPLRISLAVSGLVILSAGLEAQQARFVYTNNDVFPANSVTGFSADANGVLTQVSGSPFSTGGDGKGGGGFAVNRVTVAGGKFLYASNGGSHTIAAFSIDPSSGILTAVSTSPYSAGFNTSWGDISLAATPDGKFLFAGNSSNNTLVTFTIGVDGSLSLASSRVASGQPAGMKVSQDGQYLVVAFPGFGGGSVGVFTIAADGSLTPAAGSPFADGGFGNLAGVDVNCSSSRVFGAEMIAGPNMVDVFSIGTGGVLAPIQGSPFAPGGGTNSNIAALSPDDKFLFVSNQATSTVSAFNVDSAGALTLVAGSPFAAASVDGVPAGMATDQAGTLLYVAGSPNQVHAFNIAVNGSLSPVAGSPFSTNVQSGQNLSLVAFPAKSCSAPPVNPPPPPPPVDPPPPPPVTPPPPPPVTPPPPPPVTPPPPPPVTPPQSGDAMTVTIDIWPSCSDWNDDDSKDPNARINLKSWGKIRVAILSTKTFNAPATVDMHSLTFGHTGTEKSLGYCEIFRRDVNHDKLPDLVCHFYTQKTKFQKTDTLGLLKGKLRNGKPIQGSEAIRIVR